MVVPEGPGFNIENAWRRILQDFLEYGIAKNIYRQSNVVPITVSHHLRGEPDDVIEPFLRISPPENPFCHGNKGRTKVVRNTACCDFWRQTDSHTSLFSTAIHFTICPG